jgi:hypothetical protein
MDSTQTPHRSGCNAAEFELDFYLVMHEWVAGGKAGPDPRKMVEQQPKPGWVWRDCPVNLIRESGGLFRWKRFGPVELATLNIEN